MHIIQGRQSQQGRSFSFCSKILSGTLIAISMLLVAGCGGGGSSSSGGEATFAGSKTMVQGNINSVGPSLSLNSSQSGTFDIARIIEVLGSGVISSAVAADRTVEGIEVCIEGICTTTDANGSFLLDLDGVPGGTYPISFYVNGATYTSEIEVIDDSLVTLENISISDDGIVRVNNIKIVLIDDDISEDNVSEDDVSEDDVSEDDVSEDGAVAKVLVCHKPGTPAEKTLTLPTSALKGHLGHGDTEGACEKS